MLVDDILESIRKSEALNELSTPWKHYQELLASPKTVHIDADSVARQITHAWPQGMTQEAIEAIYGTGLCMRPPAFCTWVEFAYGSAPWLHASFYQHSGALPGSRMGLLIQCASLKERGIQEIYDSYTPGRDGWLPKEPPGARHFMIISLMLISAVNRLASSAGFVIMAYLDDAGSLLANPDDPDCLLAWAPTAPIEHLVSSTDGEVVTPKLRREFLSVATYQGAAVGMYTLALLNAKNIELRREPARPKLDKKRLKQGRLPHVRMHTLDVALPAKVLRGERQPGEPTGEKRPLHLVRGHFSDYRQGKGLFGKHKVLLWIPQHARGAEEVGVVQKRYRTRSAS